MSILKSQGKALQIDKINSGILSFETYIMSNEYYLTNLDIWILAKHYNLPIVFISSSRLQENKKHILSTVKSNNFYYIIKIPAVQKNVIPAYSIIQNNDAKIQEILLKKSLIDEIKSSYIDLNQYIKETKIIYKKLIIKKKIESN